MTDLPDFDDAFMRAAFDPAFKFPPMPAPPIEHEIARIERSAKLTMDSAPCDQCGAKPTIAGWDGDLPRVMEHPHAPECPNYIE